MDVATRLITPAVGMAADAAPAGVVAGLTCAWLDVDAAADPLSATGSNGVGAGTDPSKASGSNGVDAAAERFGLGGIDVAGTNAAGRAAGEEAAADGAGARAAGIVASTFAWFPTGAAPRLVSAGPGTAVGAAFGRAAGADAFGVGGST